MPAADLPLVKDIKKTLNLRSNTAVIRVALQELKKKLDRKSLKNQFQLASTLVSQANKKDMQELDALEDIED